MDQKFKGGAANKISEKYETIYLSYSRFRGNNNKGSKLLRGFTQYTPNNE
jgi:hypothetical protein